MFLRPCSRKPWSIKRQGERQRRAKIQNSWWTRAPSKVPRRKEDVPRRIQIPLHTKKIPIKITRWQSVYNTAAFEVTFTKRWQETIRLGTTKTTKSRIPSQKQITNRNISKWENSTTTM